MSKDLLAPSGRAAKFETIGTVHKGTVISRETRQQKDYATGTPKTWDDGSPMLEVVIDLDVAGEIEPTTLYVRGAMLRAIREAVQKSGAHTVEIGGTLAVQYQSDGEPSKPGFTAPKLYVAQYKPPAAADLLGGSSTPQTTVVADDLI
jgi:hypothetical protein